MLPSMAFSLFRLYYLFYLKTGVEFASKESYNTCMRTIVIGVVSVFILAWGLSLFFGFLSGVKNVSMPETPFNRSGPAYQEEQRRIATESEDQQKRIMQDYQMQMRTFKSTTGPGMR